MANSWIQMAISQRDNTYVLSEGQFIELTNLCIQVLLYLLRRCYGLIYRLLSSSEPVSEELMPIVSIRPNPNYSLLIRISFKANKLSTVKKCLNEVLKYGGPWSPRDLYPVRIPHALPKNLRSSRSSGIRSTNLPYIRLTPCGKTVNLLDTMVQYLKVKVLSWHI